MKNKLKLAAGWKIVEPRHTEYLIAWEKDFSLQLSVTSFKSQKILNRATINPACPHAFDSNTGFLYLVEHCVGEEGNLQAHTKSSAPESSLFQKINSYISSISLLNFKKNIIAEAPLGYEFNWCLKLSSDGKTIVSYVIPSYGSSKSKKNNFLAIIDIPSKKLSLIPFDEKVFYPQDVSFEHEAIIISTFDHNLALFNFKGKIIRKIPYPPYASGASFHPDGEKVVYGLPKICIWEPYANKIEALATPSLFGFKPVWSLDGHHIWFYGSDALLCSINTIFNSASEIIEFFEPDKCVVSSVKYCRKPIFSPCGRYLFCNLTKQNGKVYSHLSLILDIQEKLVWYSVGNLSKLVWIKGISL